MRWFYLLPRLSLTVIVAVQGPVVFHGRIHLRHTGWLRPGELCPVQLVIAALPKAGEPCELKPPRPSARFLAGNLLEPSDLLSACGVRWVWGVATTDFLWTELERREDAVGRRPTHRLNATRAVGAPGTLQPARDQGADVHWRLLRRTVVKCRTPMSARWAYLRTRRDSRRTPLRTRATLS